MSQDVAVPLPLDTTGCGPGADRCVRARTAPDVIIRCERHFLAACSMQFVADDGSWPPLGTSHLAEHADLRDAG